MWCGGTAEYPASPEFNEEHKIQCESHYVDPILPVPNGYAFDCTGECAPCVYTTNDDGNYICKIDNALKTTGCAGTPSHPATTTRTRLMGSLGAGGNSYCWKALDGYDGDTPKDKCESYFVDPVDPDIPDTYTGGCSGGCSLCIYNTADGTCTGGPKLYPDTPEPSPSPSPSPSFLGGSAAFISAFSASSSSEKSIGGVDSELS